MHDVKNVFIAWTCSATSLFAAVETGTLITILSAVVLPIIFFTIGKSVDVALQMYFRFRDERRKEDLAREYGYQRVGSPTVREDSTEQR
jgi:hypothetical protein